MNQAAARTTTGPIELDDLDHGIIELLREAGGFGMLLAIGVEVENRAPEAVARDMARLQQVFSVNVVVGAQDIEILVVARDQADLDSLLSETLVGIPGVRRLTPALAVDVLKNQPDWVPFHDA